MDKFDGNYIYHTKRLSRYWLKMYCTVKQYLDYHGGAVCVRAMGYDKRCSRTKNCDTCRTSWAIRHSEYFKENKNDNKK